MSIFLGDDEGRVFGALIAGAGRISPTHKPTKETEDYSEHSNEGRTRKRRRKRQKRKNVTVGSEKESSSNSPLLSERTIATPVEKKEGNLSIKGSSSLRLLTAYSDSDSSCGNSDVNQPSVEPEARESFAVPEAIRGMFGDKELEISEEEGYSIGSGDNLGYFEANDSSSDNESRDSAFMHQKEQKIESLSVSKQWNEEKGQWKFGDSALSSYTCWKCSNVGHLANDCTVAVSSEETSSRSGARVKIPKTLQALYAACREIKRKKGQRCADCGVHSNLASCLDCR